MKFKYETQETRLSIFLGSETAENTKQISFQVSKISKLKRNPFIKFLGFETTETKTKPNLTFLGFETTETKTKPETTSRKLRQHKSHTPHTI